VRLYSEICGLAQQRGRADLDVVRMRTNGQKPDV
jgi:hypothetical protein